MDARRTVIALMLIAGMVYGLFIAPGAHAGTVNDVVKVGVLAKRGKVHCQARWQPTVDYLSTHIPGVAFQLVTLDFEEVEPVVATGGVDFILANPSFYVELEYRYGVDRIATLINRNTVGGFTRFAGVIFTRSDRRDIAGIADLKRQRFMAVKETSLGGWRMALRELTANGIDPARDFKTLSFGGTHDAVVFAVLEGSVDAGTVRSDTLERMAAEGLLRMDQVRVLPHVHEDTSDVPFVHSTRSYPEWPIARVHHTPEALARKVAVALLQMSADDPAATTARIAGWTIPLNYQPVHDCLRELKIGPYATLGRISPLAAARELWRWIALALAGFVIMGGAVAAFINLNRKLMASNAQLTAEAHRRKEITRALADAEHFNRSIVSSVGEGIIVYDREMRYRIWNQQMAFITGLEADDVVGRSPTDLFPHICQRGVDVLLKRALAGETVTSPDTPYYVPQTKRCGWVVGTYGPHVSSDGEVMGVVAAVRDITNRKIAEEDLKAANERFKSVMDGMDSLVYVADMGTYEILYINQYGKNVWGDVTGKTCWQVLQSGQAGPCGFCTNAKLLDDLGHPTGVHVWEFQNTISSRWYECRDQAIQWADRRFVRLEIATEITARKEANDKLVEQYQFMSHVLESLTHPFLVINVDDYTIEIANACAGKMAPGATCYRITHRVDHPCGDDDHPCPIAIIQETGRPTVVEHIHYNEAGEPRHVAVHGYPIRNSAGRITKIIEYSLDITDRKHAEATLQEKEEYLRTIMSTVQTGVIISEWDTGRITDANPFAARLIGNDRNALIGNRVTQYLPPIDIDSAYTAGEESLLTTVKGQTRNIRISNTAVCIRDKCYAVHSFMDVTDMRELIDQQAVNVELAKGLLDLVNGNGNGYSVCDDRMALHLEAVSLPCRAAGGDHHFIRRLEGDGDGGGSSTYISVKDQSGHEVNCILRSIYTDLIHNAILNQNVDAPLEKTLQLLNARLIHSGMFASDDFFTGIFARIDHRSLDMHYAACGHPPFLLVRDGVIASLPQSGGLGQNLPLGTIEDIGISSGRIKLRVGDRLLFYTDGLTEMPLEKEGWKISRRRLEEMTADLVAEQPDIRVSTLMQRLLDVVAGLSGHQVTTPGTNSSSDDITIMGLEVEDIRAATAVVLSPTDTAALCRDIRELAHRITDEWSPGLTNAARRVRTVLEEAVLNAWKNGHRKTPGLPITVRWRAGNRFHLQVTDIGPGFDPESIADPRLMKNRFATSGRGIFMIRMNADEVSWQDGGRRLIARFDRRQTPEKNVIKHILPIDFPLRELSVN